MQSTPRSHAPPNLRSRRGARMLDQSKWNFAPARLAPCLAVASRRGGFTLLELLVVIGVIAILTTLVIPAFTARKTADDVTNAAYTIKGFLEAARTFAKSNNTYTWVGFYEEDANIAGPTNFAPPYPGRGRVVLATVYSNDGTSIYSDTDPPAQLPNLRIAQLNKLTRIEGIHLTDVGNPSPTPTATPRPGTLAARPDWPYTEGSSLSPPLDHWNRISSDTDDTARFWFATQNYTFRKNIRFTPRGEASINSMWIKLTGEIGIRPAHGNSVDANSPNVVAIQIAGVGGNIKIYRP